MQSEHRNSQLVGTRKEQQVTGSDPTQSSGQPLTGSRPTRGCVRAAHLHVSGIAETWKSSCLRQVARLRSRSHRYGTSEDFSRDYAMVKAGRYFLSHHDESVALYMNWLKLSKTIAENAYARSIKSVSPDGLGKESAIKTQTWPHQTDHGQGCESRRCHRLHFAAAGVSGNEVNNDTGPRSHEIKARPQTDSR